MTDKLLQDEPCQGLLSKRALLAVMKTWTPKMTQVSAWIAHLPPKAGKSPEEAQMNAWGFIFALDALRHKAPAIQALLEVVDTFTERPKREEVFQIVDRLLAFKVEVRTKLKNHTALGPRTTGKVGFVRRRN